MEKFIKQSWYDKSSYMEQSRIDTTRTKLIIRTPEISILRETCMHRMPY